MNTVKKLVLVVIAALMTSNGYAGLTDNEHDQQSKIRKATHTDAPVIQQSLLRRLVTKKTVLAATVITACALGAYLYLYTGTNPVSSLDVSLPDFISHEEMSAMLSATKQLSLESKNKIFELIEEKLPNLNYRQMLMVSKEMGLKVLEHGASPKALTETLKAIAEKANIPNKIFSECEIICGVESWNTFGSLFSWIKGTLSCTRQCVVDTHEIVAQAGLTKNIVDASMWTLNTVTNWLPWNWS